MSRNEIKLFYDFEIIDTGSLIVPISLGVTTSTGNELYMINKLGVAAVNSYEHAWIDENVLPKLHLMPPHINPTRIVQDIREMRDMLCKFVINLEEKFDLIGYYADYDHVAYAQLFGEVVDLSQEHIGNSCNLKQWLDDVGLPTSPIKNEVPHNALSDAYWIRDTYNWLKANYQHTAWSHS